jgi:hypothetical protein
MKLIGSNSRDLILRACRYDSNFGNAALDVALPAPLSPERCNKASRWAARHSSTPRRDCDGRMPAPPRHLGLASGRSRPTHVRRTSVRRIDGVFNPIMLFRQERPRIHGCGVKSIAHDNGIPDPRPQGRPRTRVLGSWFDSRRDRWSQARSDLRQIGAFDPDHYVICGGPVVGDVTACLNGIRRTALIDGRLYL